MEIKPPAISTSQNGPIPSNLYTVRFTKGVKNQTQDKGLTIQAKFEILTPDIVQHPTDPERQLNVAGRKASVTIYVSPLAKLHDDSCEMLRRLNLLNLEGNIDPDYIVSILDSGKLCAEVLLGSEEDFAKKPDNSFILSPRTGEKISLGHKVAFIFPKNVIGAVEVEGLPPIGGAF